MLCFSGRVCDICGMSTDVNTHIMRQKTTPVNNSFFLSFFFFLKTRQNCLENHRPVQPDGSKMIRPPLRLWWKTAGHSACNLRIGQKTTETRLIVTEINPQRMNTCKIGNYSRTPCKFNPARIRLMSTLAVSTPWFTHSYDFKSCLLISCLLCILDCLLTIKIIIGVSLANEDK